MNSVPIIAIGTLAEVAVSRASGSEPSPHRSSNVDAMPSSAGTRHLVEYHEGPRDDGGVIGGPEADMKVDIGEEFPATYRDIGPDVLDSRQTSTAAMTPELVETSAVTESAERLPRHSSFRSSVEPEVAYARHSEDDRSMTSAATKDTSSERKASYGRTCCPTCRQRATITPSSLSRKTSEDLLGKVMQQNARLKQTLREVISKQGLITAQYLDIKERDDVILLLRYEIDDYRRRYRNLCDLFMRLSHSDSVPL